MQIFLLGILNQGIFYFGIFLLCKISNMYKGGQKNIANVHLSTSHLQILSHIILFHLYLSQVYLGYFAANPRHQYFFLYINSIFCKHLYCMVSLTYGNCLCFGKSTPIRSKQSSCYPSSISWIAHSFPHQLEMPSGFSLLLLWSVCLLWHQDPTAAIMMGLKYIFSYMIWQACSALMHTFLL